MKEKANRSVPTEIMFVHVTTNISLDMHKVITDTAFMSVAQREYDQIRNKLLSSFSFITTVLECITKYDPEWEKQINVSASLLAVEAHAMNIIQEQGTHSDICLKSDDIEAIFDWTCLQYKNGAFRRTNKGYKWRVALIFLLLNEVSEKQKRSKKVVK